VSAEELKRTIAAGGVLFDGAMGSALAVRGLERDDSSALWNLTHPEDVAAVHATFARAGADVVTTNTFVASRPALAASGAAAQVADVHAAAVRLARESGARWIAGDLGPIGGWLGEDAEPRALRDAYAEQAAFLVADGVDALIVETLGDPDELIAAVAGCRDAGAPLVIGTMTFTQAGDAYESHTGAALDACLEAMEASGADVVGTNCMLAPDAMDALADALLARVARPVLMQPNAGPDAAHYDVTPEAFAAWASRMLARGAHAVGGCCGIGPAHVAAARSMMEDTGRRFTAR